MSNGALFLGRVYFLILVDVEVITLLISRIYSSWCIYDLSRQLTATAGDSVPTFTVSAVRIAQH